MATTSAEGHAIGPIWSRDVGSRVVAETTGTGIKKDNLYDRYGRTHLSYVQVVSLSLSCPGNGKDPPYHHRPHRRRSTSVNPRPNVNLVPQQSGHKQIKVMTRTINIIHNSLLNVGIMLSVVFLPYEFGNLLHRPGEETHPGEQVEMQLSDMGWRPRIIIHTTGQDMLF